MKPCHRWLLMPIITVFLLLGAFFATLQPWAYPEPPLPPLLLNVTGKGGVWGACPGVTDEQVRIQKSGPLALSPELDQRLTQMFPPGTKEEQLVGTLRQQGFELLPPCEGDTSIRSASFDQHGGGLFWYPMNAAVFWKTDNANNIVWTKGFVAYTAL